MKLIRLLKGAGIFGNYGTMGAASVTLIQGDKNILVDTGHFGNRDLLLKRLVENKISPSDIDIIFLTHMNWDHCLNLDIFENAEVIIGKSEYELGTLTGINDNISKKFIEYLKERDLKLVKGGENISPNSSVIYTPGHTPGHISLLLENGNNKIIFSGDAIPNRRAFIRGIPDIVFYNLEKAKESIIKIKNLHPDIIFPGHDPPFNENGYIENDQVNIFMRNEDETDFSLSIGKNKASQPVIYNE